MASIRRRGNTYQITVCKGRDINDHTGKEIIFYLPRTMESRWIYPHQIMYSRKSSTDITKQLKKKTNYQIFLYMAYGIHQQPC